ncbi:PIR Superfamily Protein [Plasmodium ovale wallikeri]|uniref:PIR Superfamily Protein n=2 Tax=Plasmodium ovale TaxID=36330 RepID=A0A1A9AIW8_PLAOA|nr:PIR Superfamily Protein [Plasmodium ovale wallikeri]SBT56558.1 PIR Superfamily Protein [Plasmodium ovale wallikeri]SBT73864.1 PIR protein [Plasmodium ovale]
MSPHTQIFSKAKSSYTKYEDELLRYRSDQSEILMFGCNGFQNEYLRNVEDNASKICDVTLNFLRHLKESNNFSYQKHGCNYLLYWLYVEVLKKGTSIENTLILYKALNDTFNEENDGLYLFDYYINQMSKDTFDKIEKINRIYEVFNTYIIKLTSPIKNNNCTTDCIALFNSYAGECRKQYDEDFCNELKIFREQYNTFIEKVISCEGEQYLLPPVDNFDTVGIIIIPFVLILVASFIVPLLYKFTPVGTWIRHKIGKKEKIWDNINEETQLLSNTYEIEEYKSKNRNYNISYNSS